MEEKKTKLAGASEAAATTTTAAAAAAAEPAYPNYFACDFCGVDEDGAGTGGAVIVPRNRDRFEVCNEFTKKVFFVCQDCAKRFYEAALRTHIPAHPTASGSAGPSTRMKNLERIFERMNIPTGSRDPMHRRMLYELCQTLDLAGIFSRQRGVRIVMFEGPTPFLFNVLAMLASSYVGMPDISALDITIKYPTRKELAARGISAAYQLYLMMRHDPRGRCGSGWSPSKSEDRMVHNMCWNPTCPVRVAPHRPHSLCGSCQVATYCSRECQIADWKHHREACSYVAETLKKRQEALRSNP